MQVEARGLAALRGVEAHLGEQLVAAPPCRLQRLEGGAVLEAVVGQRVLQCLELDRLGPGWWPGLGSELLELVRFAILRAAQAAARVPHPVAVLAAGVNGQLAAGQREL